MTFDTPTLAIIITVLLAIIGLAAAWGALTQRVRQHDAIIETNRKAAEQDNERLHCENREDHKLIFLKLEEINNFLRNGKAK